VNNPVGSLMKNARFKLLHFRCTLVVVGAWLMNFNGAVWTRLGLNFCLSSIECLSLQVTSGHAEATGKAERPQLLPWGHACCFIGRDRHIALYEAIL